MKPDFAPWYTGRQRDMVIYLLAAIFFLEMIVGGVAFFYGLVHAAPESAGGPPIARFPLLPWAIAAVLAPVFLLLLVRIIGSWISGSLDGGNDAGGPVPDGEGKIPDRVRSFYAIARSAPAIVVLAGILILGAALILADGALDALKGFLRDLMPHLPLLAALGCAFFAALYLVHRWFLYRQRRMEAEYAYRREVLERTGIVLVDRGSMRLPPAGGEAAAPPIRIGGVTESPPALPAVLDVTDKNAPSGSGSD